MYIERNNTNTDVVNKLANAIANKTPYILFRAGDGELNLLKDPGNQNQVFLNKSLRVQGVTGAEHWEIFKKRIIDIIRVSDMIGLSTEYINEVRPKASACKIKWNISAEELEKNNLYLNDKDICDHRIHLSKELGMVDNFKNIIQGNDIHIVGYYTGLLSENKLDEKLQCNISYTKTPNHFYKNRNNIEPKILQIKEDIVLMGTGGIGFHIACKLKEMGKIVIDVGSLLDAWAGIWSRPWFGPNGANRYVVFTNKNQTPDDQKRLNHNVQ